MFGTQLTFLYQITITLVIQLTKFMIYRFIKHYSPYCIHCKKIAPTWQAIYEHYIQSSPSTPSSPHPASPPSFTETYDFHFANINCAEDGDLCEAHKIQAYPSFILYKDGEVADELAGKKDKDSLVAFIEKHLEKIKPGTRPAKVEVATPVPSDAVVSSSTMAASVTVVSSTAATPTSDSVEAVKQSQQKLSPQNAKGVSESLSAETFKEKITMTNDGWFVKFYAPWCSHCQAMAPAWKVMSTEMRGKLNIGEVNCEVEKQLCKDQNVNSYPTIIFFKDKNRVDYNGLRGLGDLVSWANKAAEAGVREVKDAAEFEALEKKNEVIFLYFYDHAGTSEDFDALNRVTLPLIGHAPLYKTNSELLARRFRITTWPRLIVVRDSKPLYYKALSPDDMRNTERVVRWMASVWLPMVPELTASNSHEVMNHKTVVLGVLDRRRKDQFESARKELKAAALEWLEYRAQEAKQERQELRDNKQLRIEEAEDRNDARALNNAKNIRVQLSPKREVGFAWIDGVFWERWIKETYGIEVQTMGERIIINDEDRKLYWDETKDGNSILPSRSSILETVRDITRNNPNMKPKSTVGKIETALRRVKTAGSGHPVWSSFLFFAVIFIAALWWRGRSRRAQGYNQVGLGHPGAGNNDGFFSGWLSEKGGLFGGNNNGGGKFD